MSHSPHEISTSPHNIPSSKPSASQNTTAHVNTHPRGKWVLASASPRRHALIKQLGLSVISQTSAVDERAEPDELPRDFALRMAEEKALNVARARSDDPEIKHILEYTIGGDTVVALGARILGKPEDVTDATCMLSALSGRAHDVWSGWAVVARDHTRSPYVVCSGVAHAEVVMRALTLKEIERYVATGEPLDKAGSYGIQGLGGRFVTQLKGSLYGVIGLPLSDLDSALRAHGLIDESALTTRGITLRERVATAAWRSGRSVDEVNVLAVSKYHSPERILSLGERGFTDFGESYLQEFTQKRAALSSEWSEACQRGQVTSKTPIWHYIGGIQRNKARRIGAAAQWIHGVSRFAEAQKIAEGAAEVDECPRVLIQVNLAGEAQKGGAEPAEVEALLTRCITLDTIAVVGLMTFPPLSEPEESRRYFRALRELRDTLTAQGFELPHLSMGTSHDFEIAIEEGATWVRLGRALLGERER